MKPLIRNCMLLLIVILIPFFSKSTAQSNTSYGTGAGSTGTFNTAFGYKAGDIVTGTGNLFVGAYTGQYLTSGSRNTLLGSECGGQSSSGPMIGSDNTFTGHKSGIWMSTGNHNSFFGSAAGFGNNAGNSNTYIGSYSGNQGQGANFNVALGYYAGYSNVNGNDNISIGSEASYHNVRSSNISIGRGAGYNNIYGNANIFIGYQSGYNETGSNKLYIDNSSTSTPLIYGDFNTNQVGINALPGIYTLNVGGTLNATSLYINGQPFTSTGVWQPTTGVIYNNTANVGIGTMLTNNPNGYKLAVNGKIGAKEVQIENNSLTWSDFVFKKDYKLPTLTEVETFIQANGHLKDIPSEKEVKEKGIELAEMNAKLLQKIEELTLYVIELRKEVDGLKHQVKK